MKEEKIVSNKPLGSKPQKTHPDRQRDLETKKKNTVDQSQYGKKITIEYDKK